MTIADLERLLREHLPEFADRAGEQGRAGVTNTIADRNRNARYELTRRVDLLRKPEAGDETMSWHYWDEKRVCEGCGQVFDRHGTRRKYHSDACKQAAYRARKKAAKQRDQDWRKQAAS